MRLLTLQVSPSCQNSLLLVYHSNIETVVEKTSASSSLGFALAVRCLTVSVPNLIFQVSTGSRYSKKVTLGIWCQVLKNLQTCFSFTSHRPLKPANSSFEWQYAIPAKPTGQKKWSHTIVLSYCKPFFHISNCSRSSFRCSIFI